MRRRTGLAAIFALAASPVWAGVAGRVLDGEGAPVAGAVVTAYAPEAGDDRIQRLYDGRERAPVGSARSGPDGTFRIDGAAPVLEVQAVAEGHAPAFALAASDLPVTLAVKPAATRRGVVTAGGRPVAGARVVWMGATGEWIARTQADGSYLMPDSGGALFHVRVFHPDFAPFDSIDAAEFKLGLDRTLDAGVMVEGRAVDERGQAVSGAAVWVGGSTLWPMGRSAADGTFRVAHAPRHWRTVRARSRSLTGYVSRKSGPQPLVLRPGGRLAGTVRDAATGGPLAGSTVSVTSWSAAYGSVLTDAAGAYRFDLPAGRYQVTAERPGYGTVAKLAPDEAVDLRTAAQARYDVALRKTPVARGRVLDEAGRPVEGATVVHGVQGTPYIYAPDPYLPLGEDEGGSRTEANGAFSMPLPEQEDFLLGPARDRPLVVLKRGYAAARVDLEAGPAGPAPVVVTLTRGIEMSGRVRSPAGAPLASVAVVLAEEGTVFGSMVPASYLLGELKGEGWTTTDTDGRFRVRVHPKVHHLGFRGAGLAPQVVTGYDPRRGEALEVVMEPAATLRGRVVRPDGRAVPDVTITLGQLAAMQEEKATSGADGHFEITDLARGAYELTAQHEKLGIRETRIVEVPAADWQLVLEASGTLRGRVVDASTGQPLRTFRIGVSWAEEPGHPGGSRSADVDDAAGAFELADVPARAASVWASADGYVDGRINDVAVPAGAEGLELEIALEADVPIRGHVTTEDRSALPQTTVSVVTTPREGLKASVDDRGEYELRGVPAGEVTLAFQARGFLGEKRTLDTRQTTLLDVTLRRGLALSGVVVSDGAGVAGAAVSATSTADNATYEYTKTDQQGQFKLQGLVPARYQVTASAEGKRTVKLEDVDPETAGALRLVLEREPQATLAGKVVGLPAGQEFVYAEVKASNDERQSSALVDGTRTFRMEDAPTGRVTVVGEANTPMGMRHSRAVDVTLAPGAEAEIVLEFPGGVVSGQVTRDGRPVPGVNVSFEGAGLVEARGRADVRGVYEVVGLENGRYQVSVSGDGSSFQTEYLVSGSGELDIDITGGAIQGRALRADGETPLPGVEVSLWPVGAHGNQSAGSATTDSEGEFTLRSLREGRYRLTTFKAGFGQQVREVEVASGATASVLLELSPAAGVSVSVVDARDGRALEATVVVRDLARRIVANSHSGADESGALTIPLADGSYLLSTSAGGYGTATLPVTAPSQGLRVGLTPGGTLAIESARDLRGRARLVQPDGEEYVQCWCNGIAEIELTGRRTTVEHVTPGSYTLEVLDDAEVVARKPVVIRENQKTIATIE